MRGVLAAVVTTALAITAVESLSCPQCDSFTNSCVNVSASECPLNANTSCLSSSASSSLGAFGQHQEMSCSAASCSGEMESFPAFTVRIADGELFSFARQCCHGKACDVTNSTLDSPPDPSNMECPTCYGSDISSCLEKPQKCYQEERCVYLITQFNNGTEVVLKGCSNIRNSTCQLLAAGNQTAGGLIFQRVECTDALVATSNQTTNYNYSTSNQTIDSSTGSPTSNQTIDSSTGSPTSNQTIDSSTGSSSPKLTTDLNTGSRTSALSKPTTHSNLGCRAFLNPLALASLFLLRLLL